MYVILLILLIMLTITDVVKKAHKIKQDIVTGGCYSITCSQSLLIYFITLDVCTRMSEAAYLHKLMLEAWSKCTTPKEVKKYFAQVMFCSYAPCKQHNN